ncbi:MAG: hypothetical protein MJZ20_12400 [Bacteroidaceae bacterium]|nr:hypothetical protein [Bacteroidaceae bacterium]
MTNKDKEKFLLSLESLLPNFFANHNEIVNSFNNITLDKTFCDAILYLNNARSLRFKLFLIMYEYSKNMKTNSDLAYYVFREAYIMSDNIYRQIKEENSRWDNIIFLKNLGNQTFFINHMQMLDEESFNIFQQLPERVIIYRGMSFRERFSKSLGISWTINKTEAEQYVFYKKNNSKWLGWVAECSISKFDIITIVGIKGENKEILCAPNRESISFHLKSRVFPFFCNY